MKIHSFIIVALLISNNAFTSDNNQPASIKALTAAADIACRIAVIGGSAAGVVALQQYMTNTSPENSTIVDQTFLITSAGLTVAAAIAASSNNLDAACFIGSAAAMSGIVHVAGRATCPAQKNNSGATSQQNN